MEFRSNRVFNGNGFFVAVTCINPAPFRVARQAGLQQRDDCMTSKSLPLRRVGRRKRSQKPQMDIVRICLVFDYPVMVMRFRLGYDQYEGVAIHCSLRFNVDIKL